MPTHFYTGNDFFMKKRDVFSSCEELYGAITLKADDAHSFEGFKGFGVALTGSSCFLLSKTEKKKRKRFLEDIFTKKGLDLSLIRLSIGSSDYSPELYTYDDFAFDISLEHFSVKRDEEYIIPIIKEVLEIKPDLTVIASPWSPPGWMKTGGKICGGFMREEYIDCYSDYTVRFLQAYRSRGINIHAISPQNEPETHQKGRMPACMWHPEIEGKYIKLLRSKLDKAGLDTKIWLFDHNFNGTDRVLWQLENIEGLVDSIDAVAFHYYEGNIESTLKIKERFPSLDFHLTEGGPRLYDNYASDFCKWAIMASKAVACNYLSMTGWNLLLDENGGPNIGPFFCGGLATLSSDNGDFIYSGQYKAFKHISPYIDSKTRLYPITSSEKENMFDFPKVKRQIEGFMAINGEKKYLILANAASEKKQAQINIDGVRYYIELLPETLSTIEF